MKTVKLGLVGFGNMGSLHAKNVTGGRVPGMELIAVADIDKEKRNEIKRLYPEVEVYETADDMYDKADIDLVLIAVPHYAHTTLAIKAFSHGFNVITEKPAGVFVKQVMEMNAAAEKSGKIFGIMYNQRTNPCFQKIKHMIDSGEIGGIKRISWVITDWYRPQAYHDSAAWRSKWATEGGGTLINQNPHQLDLWQWLFGMPDRLISFISYGRYHNIEVDDDLTTYMEYDNGVTGTYIASTGEWPGTNRLEIACDMGRIVLENWQLKFKKSEVSERVFEKTNKDPDAVPGLWESEALLKDNWGEQHVGILKDFVKVFNGEKEQLLAPGYEGIKGLTISNAMHYSSWTHEMVDLNNFPHDDFYARLKEKILNSSVNNTLPEEMK